MRIKQQSHLNEDMSELDKMQDRGKRVEFFALYPEASRQWSNRGIATSENARDLGRGTNHTELAEFIVFIVFIRRVLSIAQTMAKPDKSPASSATNVVYIRVPCFQDFGRVGCFLVGVGRGACI